MGNVEVRDLGPIRDDERCELNLSRNVTHKQYCKHTMGDTSEQCLTELPWNIRDSISLYEQMDISFNALTEIPPELPLRLPHLHTINLSHNKLCTLPESFGLLFHLRILLLNNNHIYSLPTSFVHLIKLTKLDLSNNRLKELPSELGAMESLEKLNVSNNKLKQLPESLATCKTLTLILAKHNRLLNPPQNVCNEGSQAIIKYYRKNYTFDCEKEEDHMSREFPRHRGVQLKISVPNPQTAQAEYEESQCNSANTASRIRTPLLPPLNSSTFQAHELRNKLAGMFFGAAIGDAIGLATSGMTQDDCEFHYIPETLTYSSIIRDEFRVHWKRGDWSDNFDQVVLVLESVLHWGGVVDELDFAQRLVQLSEVGFPEVKDRTGHFTSETIQQVIKMKDFLKSPHTAARDLQETKEKSKRFIHDSGALCRSMVLGIVNFYDLNEVTSNALRICKATHTDTVSIASAVTFAACIAYILQGKFNLNDAEDLERMMRTLLDSGKRSLTSPQEIKKFEDKLLTIDLKSIDFHAECEEDHPFNSLAAGFIALRTGLNYKDMLLELLMLGGSSHTHCCITGALLGAKLGYTSLPIDWLGGLRKTHSDWLTAKINHLLDLMGIP